MSSVRRFELCDLFSVSAVNLDALTETYPISYYAHYLSIWPQCFLACTSPSASTTAPPPVMGYMMGKIEGGGTNLKGHVSALSVSPDYRRLNVARILMTQFETDCDERVRAHFVDLYVRQSNARAIAMYRHFGYIIYRQVILYYSGVEDAYDMRKALSADVDKKSVIPLAHPVHPGPND